MNPSEYINIISAPSAPISPPQTPTPPLADGKLTLNMISSDWDVHPVSTLSRGLVQFLLESQSTHLNVISMNKNDDPGGGRGGWWRNNITGMIEDNYTPGGFQQGHLQYVDGGLAERTESLRQLNANVCIDLNGRTMGNALELFDEQICELQVTYLGLPKSTGLGSMDYILTDRTSTGGLESGEEKWYSEKQAILSNQVGMPRLLRHCIPCTLTQPSPRLTSLVGSLIAVLHDE